MGHYVRGDLSKWRAGRVYGQAPRKGKREVFDLSRILELEPDFLTGEDDHQHDDAVSSVSPTLDHPLDHANFNRWTGALLMERGQDLLRTKG